MAFTRYQSYELWVPEDRAKQARDALYTDIFHGEAEPMRGPDVPSTPHTQAYATFLVTLDLGLLARRKSADARLIQIARQQHGQLWRCSKERLHTTISTAWGPSQRVGSS